MNNKDMIELLITKAIEWLEEHLLEYWGQQNSDPSEFFIEFKKAMEE